MKCRPAFLFLDMHDFSEVAQLISLHAEFLAKGKIAPAVSFKVR